MRRLSRPCLIIAGLVLVVTPAVAEESRPVGPEDWAFQPLTQPEIPAIANVPRANPIDAFLLEKLNAAGLEFQPEADRATLLRRLSFDLIGLPASLEEIDAFVADEDPDAFEKRADRMFASPSFGERAALYWLDLARFAETDGFKADDSRPTAWRYRDYVIRSFNADKPYDRFVREQIAGDELYPNDADALIATGMQRHYPDEYNAINLEQRRQEILNDITDTTSAAFLGLTMGCAKCHDHKFDPIPQKDYYRLQAFFAGWWPSDVPVLDADEMADYEAKLRAYLEQTEEIRAELAKLEQPYRYSKKKLFRFPKEYSALVEIPEEERTPFQKQIAQMVAAQALVGDSEVAQAMKGDDKERWEQMRKKLAEAEVKPPKPPKGMGFTDVGPVAPSTRMLLGGNWRRPGEEMSPGFLTSLGGEDAEVQPRAQSTGRRSALAEWIASPENPLTSRVIVNRLWQQHFVNGIVTTPSDFGQQGEPPTHPELLDWLANELTRRDWSMKDLRRMMVTSTAYRQGNARIEQAVAVDSENQLLWRMNRRRLEGETLRDAILAVTGELSPHMGGPSIFPELPSEVGGSWKVSKTREERNRRSIYVFVKRNLRYPLFSAFDATDRTETCAARFATTTAPQSLMLLNDSLIIKDAANFAKRVLSEAGDDPEKAGERAFKLALGRDPSDDERKAIARFLQSHPTPGTPAVTDLCHAVLNLNEFIYVD